MEVSNTEQHCSPACYCTWLHAVNNSQEGVLERWLRQRQEHEADVIGAAISKAAGCSSEDILYALSCSKLLAHQ